LYEINLEEHVRSQALLVSLASADAFISFPVNLNMLNQAARQ
jgi:hypothetical protein